MVGGTIRMRVSKSVEFFILSLGSYHEVVSVECRNRAQNARRLSDDFVERGRNNNERVIRTAFPVIK